MTPYPPVGLPGAVQTAGLPSEEKIPRLVIYVILPALQAIFGMLNMLKKAWNTPQNNIPALIVAAQQDGRALGGYSPKDWARWGQALMALDAFLATEITILLPDGETEQATPESILLTDYVPMPIEQ